MKTLVYLFAIVMLLFAGCAKDEMFNDNETDLNLKSAPMKMVPVKADIYSVSESDFYGITTSGYLAGNFSHLGKLVPENSRYTGTILDLTDDSYTLLLEGQLGAANGDVLNYYFTLNLKFTDTSFVTIVTYKGGTGRFTNCEGSATCTGNVDPATGHVIMKVDGFITNVGSSK
jgi:hypothetical protein